MAHSDENNLQILIMNFMCLFHWFFILANKHIFLNKYGLEVTIFNYETSFSDWSHQWLVMTSNVIKS